MNKQLLKDLETAFGSFRGGAPKPEDYGKRSDYLADKYHFKHYGPPLKNCASNDELNVLWSAFEKIPKDTLTFLYSWANGASEDVLRKNIEFCSIKDSIALMESYSLMEDENLIVNKNLNDFYPIFSLHSNKAIGEIGIFLNEDSSLYLINIEEAYAYKLFDSLYVYLNFLAASKGLVGNKRGSGISYSKAEKELLENINSTDVYPLVKKRGVTVFR